MRTHPVNDLQEHVSRIDAFEARIHLAQRIHRSHGQVAQHTRRSCQVTADAHIGVSHKVLVGADY